MNKYAMVLALLSSLMLSSLILGAATATAAEHKPIDGGVNQQRITQISALLPAGPFSFGRPIADRATWNRLAAHPAFAKVVADAQKLVATPVPEMTKDIYSEYSKTGERTAHYAKTRSARYDRITTYVLAECIENKGRFIEPLQKLIASIGMKKKGHH